MNLPLSKGDTVPRMDEPTLVQRACRMEGAAISTLYRRHVQAIYRYIYYRVSDELAAEDLTAEVFLRAVEGLPNYEPRGAPFEAWLYRIAQARVADYFRKGQRERTVEIREDWPSDESPLSIGVERSFRREELRQAINQLTPDQQQVIILKFVEGLSNAEVAQILNKTEGAVKSLQHRALNALHRLVKRSDEGH
jgi:RNA polymerase sigma-70 factor (ECF subfamily)